MGITISRDEFEMKKRQVKASKMFYSSVWGNIAKSIATDLEEWDNYEEMEEKLKNGAKQLVNDYKLNNQRIGKTGVSVAEYEKQQTDLILSVLSNFKKMSLPIPEKQRIKTVQRQHTPKMNQILPTITEEDDDGKKRSRSKKRKNKSKSKKRMKSRIRKRM